MPADPVPAPERAPLAAPLPAGPGHTPLEDAQGLAFGTAMAALGVALLAHLGLVTGQTAGLALLLAYATGLPFALVFFAVNLPFWWLAWRRMGPAFTIKTFLAVALLSGLMLVQPRLLAFGHVEPVVGAVLAGMLAGAGLLALFRHRASLGGIGVLALYLQDRTGLRAGWTQMGLDAAIFAAALFVLPLPAVALSLLGAVVLNLVIGINHRPGRYTGA